MAERGGNGGKRLDLTQKELPNPASPEVLSFKFDGLVKSQNFRFYVIPAKAGIQLFQSVLDAGSSPA